MSRLLERYQFDLSDVRTLERLYGERLPDLLEPLRQADADVEAIRAQVDQYTEMAAEIETLCAEMPEARQAMRWEGEAAEAAGDSWDTVLTVLKWIAAIILYVVATLLLLLALLLIAIGELCKLIGDVLSFVAAVVAVVVVVIAVVRMRGRDNSGRLEMLWAALKEVFNGVRLAAMGIIEPVANGCHMVSEMAGKGVMWLALFLIEVGARLTDEPYDKVKKDRDGLF